jgi:phosphate transport system permease protein
MTLSDISAPAGVGSFGGPYGGSDGYGSPNGGDRPNKKPSDRAYGIELAGSAMASLAAIWLLFAIAGISAPFGLLVAWLVSFATVYAVIGWRLHGVLVMKDRLATLAVWAGALGALIPLILVVSFVVIKGGAVVIARFPHFFLGDMSQLGANSPVTAVGAGPAIVGTVEQVAIATLLTVPIGVMTATYLVDNDNWFSRFVSAVVDAMTGAPAIIAGLFVYLIWVAPLKTSGKSGVAAALALAVMMLPIVTRAAQEVVAVVPGGLREAAYALGAPQWRTISRVVLPTARVGLATAVILGVARVAGETAPVLFNAGGNAHYNWNPFHGQQDNLPLRVYELIQQPSANAIRVAWGISFVLVLVVLLLFILARLIGASNPARLFVPWRTARRKQ